MGADADVLDITGFFIDFLIVAVHQILSLRQIYPQTTFIRARKYNLPVDQSRHPGVCRWILSTVESVERAIQSGTVKRIAIVIIVENSPKERFVLDVQNLYRVTTSSPEAEQTIERHTDVAGSFPVVDAEEQLRALLSELRNHCASLDPLQGTSTFTLSMEVDRLSTSTSNDPHLWENAPLHEHIEHEMLSEDRTPGNNTTLIRHVKAGIMQFTMLYEPARVLKETPTQSLASSEAASPTLSDEYTSFDIDSIDDA